MQENKRDTLNAFEVTLSNDSNRQVHATGDYAFLPGVLNSFRQAHVVHKLLSFVVKT